MIKIRINSNAQKNLNKFRLELFENRFINELGAFIVDTVYKRVKSGYGVNDESKQNGEAEKVKLKPLSDQYKKQRRGLVEFTAQKGDKKVNVKFKVAKPQLGAFATANKSNLTLSGQLLDSISYTVNGKQIRISFKPNRNDGKSNQQIKEWTADQGREFFAITKQEMRIIRSKIDRRINELLKKYFGK